MDNECLRTVFYNEIMIQYHLRRKNVKNLNLRIRADSSIYVSASPAVNSERIDEFVRSKGEYILSSLKRFQEIGKYTPLPKQCVSGETFNILGRGLRLKVKESKKESILTDGVYLYLTVKDKNDFFRKQYLITYYLNKECQEVFCDIISEIFPVFRKYGVDFPLLRIRNMKTRWGSCVPEKGVITLNKQLLEAPRNCIEYVVMHEFCHFIQPNHSKKFYNLITMLMPDWQERKKTLDKELAYGYRS